MDLPLILLHLLLFLSLSLLPPSHSSCDPTYHSLISLAFSSVSNFHFPTSPTSPCSHFLHLHLPSSNLSGTVSWMFLQNISTLRSIDLSGNSLQGSIPGGFWSSQSLTHINLANNRLGGTLRFEPGSVRSLNLSNNRFTNVVGIAGLAGLRSLDLSRNHISLIPKGLAKLGNLEYLDFSNNHMAGKFPGDFPKLAELHFLNVSFNNLSGKVDSGSLEKFGKSAFVDAGELSFDTSLSSSVSASVSAYASDSNSKQHKFKKRRKKFIKIGVVGGSSIIVLCSMLGGIVYLLVRRNKRKKKKGWKDEEREMAAATMEVGWVVEARWGAAVVVFEKPLMELTFGDLAAATSGFGRESQLTEGGRSGPAYRAVLLGEWHVVIRVAESARGMEEREAAAAFREMARLRHPNLLPLLGYCIPGREKLLLYEYMERGDLHQWLHGLPSGDPNMDQTSEIWEPQHAREKCTSSVLAQDWPARHKIALGIARGLAFLHQGWVGSRLPVVHGHLVPSNILLDEELEPRIADFGTVYRQGEATEGGETAEGDVYSYGILVMELVTGKAKWTEERVERVRKLVREGRGGEALDPKIRMGDGNEQQQWSQEMVECLRVGYLCTAQAPEKRPTMQQVVGLLKDIRITTTTVGATTSSSTTSYGDPFVVCN